MSEVTKLYATDDTFREVADLLFGGGADELIAKVNPDSADLSERKRQKRQAQIGLATNLVGITAGTAATVESAHKLKQARKTGGHVTPFKNLNRAGKLKRLAIPATMAAGAGLALQSANVIGDGIANRVLSREAKKDVHLKKDCGMPPPTKNGKLIPTKGKLIRTVGTKAEPELRGQLKKLNEKVKKSEFDVRWEGEISKVDADKQQVFGWASIVEMDGEPVVDLQGDYISIEEVEKSAYEYVHKSRKGGDMHLRDGDQPVHASDMIESFVMTPEKKKALGFPDSTPTGWWVGYQVNDPDVWAKVKSGERAMFSIHGRGVRSDG